MYGLNIHLESFYLDHNLISKNDKIRVSITTIPEEHKESFIVDANKIREIHHFFTVNVSKYTQRIIFVFRKKNMIGKNHIIASTVVQMSDIPQSINDMNNREMKNIKIYEPFQHLENDLYAIQNRKIYGEMSVQFTPTNVYPIPTIKDNYNNFKKKYSNKYSVINTSSMNNENKIIFSNQYQTEEQNQEKYNSNNQPKNTQNKFNDNQSQLPESVNQQNQMIFVNDLI